jgi:hypothetical protein
MDADADKGILEEFSVDTEECPEELDVITSEDVVDPEEVEEGGIDNDEGGDNKADEAMEVS